MSGSAAAVPGWGLVGACGVGIMMTAIDATAINVALADIQRDLGASVSALQLIVNAFTLALVVVVVTVGRLGDMLGRRRVYLWGLVGYSVASAICALAPSDPALIVGRLLLGVSGLGRRRSRWRRALRGRTWSAWPCLLLRADPVQTDGDGPRKSSVSQGVIG